MERREEMKNYLLLGINETVECLLSCCFFPTLRQRKLLLLLLVYILIKKMLSERRRRRANNGRSALTRSSGRSEIIKQDEQRRRQRFHGIFHQGQIIRSRRGAHTMRCGNNKTSERGDKKGAGRGWL
jgi:hypothetical protein